MAPRIPVIADSNYYGQPIDGDYIDYKWLPPDVGSGGGNTSRIFLLLDNFNDNRSVDLINNIVPSNYNRNTNGVFIHPIRPLQELVFNDSITEVSYKIRPMDIRFRVYFKDIIPDNSTENEFKILDPVINNMDWRLLKDDYHLKLKIEVIKESHIIHGKFLYTTAGIYKINNISTSMNIISMSKEIIEFQDVIDRRVDIEYQTIVLEGIFTNKIEPVIIPFNIQMKSAKYEYCHRYMYVDYFPRNLNVNINIFKYWEVASIPETSLRLSIDDTTNNIDIDNDNYNINIQLTDYGIYRIKNITPTISGVNYPDIFIYYYVNHFVISTEPPMNLDGSLLEG